MKKETVYDLAFIGSGLSCSYSLLHLITALEKAGSQHCIRLLVMDKANEFWTGIPYGARSGENSLIITSLKEFLPAAELDLFILWLKENYRRSERENSWQESQTNADWIARNRVAISMGKWEKIFIPRYLFGIYLQERMAVLLQAAASNGMLNCTLVTAEATTVERVDSMFVIKARAGDKEYAITSKRVVLSIGSPPKKHLNNLHGHSAAAGFIEDMYEPSLSQNLDRIKTCLFRQNGQPKNVLVLGSNASALEIIFNLCREAGLEAVDSFYVISPDGAFPNRIEDDNHAANYLPVNLTRLQNQPAFTSAEIFEAVKNDAALAREKNVSISAIYHPVAVAIIDLLNRLSEEEQRKFVCRDGVEIGKFQRRAGSEYLDVVDTLLRLKKINFLKGRYSRLVACDDHQYTVEYHDSETCSNKIFPVAFDVIINCIGFQELSHTSCELIQSLVRQNICLVNGSNRGFEVNEDFESSEGFFVIGPLLAGNLNKKIRVWHAESCPRIFFLSQQLAEVLSRKIRGDQSRSVTPEVVHENDSAA